MSVKLCLNGEYLEQVESFVYLGIVAQHSKPIVHFVIQAPNLAQMYINILRTFSDIGPLGILSLCPPYWISKWPPFEIYICDYLWV